MSRAFSTLPLTEPLPNVPKHNTVTLSPPVVTSTKLGNGVRVTSIASAGLPLTSVGVFVENGSRFEDSSNSGSALFLRRLGFQKTARRSPLNLVRDLEALGANYVVSASREQVSFLSEFSSEKLEGVLPILSDVLHPEVEEYVVRGEVERVREDAQSALSNPQVHVLEQLHAEAFRNKGLGQPLYAVHNVGHLGVEALRSFAAEGQHGERVVVVAVGDVNHQKFSEAVGKHFSSLAAGGARSRAASQYVGGDSRVWAHGSLAHVAIGFPGSSFSDKELPSVSVLQFLLGGGRVGSREGPGAGYASRLSRNVVQAANGDVHQLSAFHLPYSDAGLFGFYGVAPAAKAPSMIDRLAKEIAALHSGPIDASELARAKAQLKAEVLFGTQTTSSLADYVGTRAIARDRNLTPSDFAKAIDAVSADEVKSAAKRVLKSKPSVSSVGDIGNVPSRDQIQSALA